MTDKREFSSDPFSSRSLYPQSQSHQLNDVRRKTKGISFLIPLRGLLFFLCVYRMVFIVFLICSGILHLSKFTYWNYILQWAFDVLFLIGIWCMGNTPLTMNWYFDGNQKRSLFKKKTGSQKKTEFTKIIAFPKAFTFGIYTRYFGCKLTRFLCLYIMPMICGICFIVCTLIVVILEKNDWGFVEDSIFGLGDYTVGDIHTADWLIHVSPALERLLLLYVGQGFLLRFYIQETVTMSLPNTLLHYEKCAPLYSREQQQQQQQQQRQAFNEPECIQPEYKEMSTLSLICRYLLYYVWWLISPLIFIGLYCFFHNPLLEYPTGFTMSQSACILLMILFCIQTTVFIGSCSIFEYDRYHHLLDTFSNINYYDIPIENIPPSQSSTLSTRDGSTMHSDFYWDREPQIPPLDFKIQENISYSDEISDVFSL